MIYICIHDTCYHHIYTYNEVFMIYKYIINKYIYLNKYIYKYIYDACHHHHHHHHHHQEKLLEPSRQVAQRKMQRLASRVEAARDHMEDVRDHMAFVMDGLRRGEFQWTPQLIPILLQVVK
jgi:hypothetical protein